MKGALTNRICDLLDSEKMNPSTFCRDLGISSSTFYTWKKRNTDPDAYLIPRICEILHVSYSYLFDGVKTDAESLSEPEKALLFDFRSIPEESREKFMSAFRASLAIYDLGRKDQLRADHAMDPNEVHEKLQSKG